MKNYILGLFLLLIGNVWSQNGGACIYMLPDSTIQCYITGNAGVGSQNACFNDAVAIGAIPIDCFDTPFASCATFYATNGIACFYGGTGSCGGGSPCDLIYLPIELVKFEGYNDNGKNRITWWVASQRDNDYFVLERSSDGVNFEEVDMMDGDGTSTKLTSFTIIDNYYERGEINYYRLKQVDFNGKFEIFYVISIDNTEDEAHVIGTYNMMGQEVEDGYDGMTITIYEDGTRIRRY